MNKTANQQSAGTQVNSRLTRNLYSLCASAVGLFLSGTCLHAAVIFDSTASTFDTPISISGVEQYAQSFTVDNNTYSSLTVTLSMAAGTTSGNFFVNLYDAGGTGNTPGNLVVALTGSTDPFAAGSYTYTGTTALSANANYYVVAGVNSGSYKWNSATAGNIAINPGSTIGFSYSSNGGVSWSAPNTSGAFGMSVDAVPEPGQWAAILASFVCVGGVATKHWTRKQAK